MIVTKLSQGHQLGGTCMLHTAGFKSSRDLCCKPETDDAPLEKAVCHCGFLQIQIEMLTAALQDMCKKALAEAGSISSSSKQTQMDV